MAVGVGTVNAVLTVGDGDDANATTHGKQKRFTVAFSARGMG